MLQWQISLKVEEQRLPYRYRRPDVFKVVSNDDVDAGGRRNVAVTSVDFMQAWVIPKHTDLYKKWQMPYWSSNGLKCRILQPNHCWFNYHITGISNDIHRQRSILLNSSVENFVFTDRYAPCSTPWEVHPPREAWTCRRKYNTVVRSSLSSKPRTLLTRPSIHMFWEPQMWPMRQSTRPRLYTSDFSQQKSFSRSSGASWG